MVEEDLTEIETIVLRYNRVAMDYLKLDNYKDTYTLLKKAENILSNEDSQQMPNRLKLVSITYNNLGCYYKKNKKPLVALSYLQRALELEIEIDAETSNIAGSHLNICAILSSISKHEDALQHAKKATALLETSRITKPGSLRIASNLVVSYYNAAVELEYLGRNYEAAGSYQSSLELALRELGKNHPMVNSLEHALQKISGKGVLGKHEKSRSRDNSATRSINVNKHSRFPSITPTLPRERITRAAFTPGRSVVGRNSPYDMGREIRNKAAL